MIKDLFKGIIKENPVFIIMLGLCPALAITTHVLNGIGMGGAVIIVLLCSNLSVSLLKRVIPESIRIPAYIVIIGTYVTIVKMLMHAYLPVLYENLGIFTDLIVVNCIILGRAQVFANKNTIYRSIMDAIGMGFGFALSLILISIIRETLGYGTITLFSIPSIGFEGKITVPGISVSPARVFVYASGALILMGLLKALFTWISMQIKQVFGKTQKSDPSHAGLVEKKIDENKEPILPTEIPPTEIPHPEGEV